jgi:hypothetical protein
MASVRNSEVRQTLQPFHAQYRNVKFERNKMMQLPNDNRSGQSETATALHDFSIYRLKHLQQRKCHITVQIVVGFSQLLLSHSQ